MGLFNIGRWGSTQKTLLAVVGLSSVLAMAGCQNAMHDENRALHQENRELRARIGEREAMKSEDAPITPPAPPAPEPEVAKPTPAPAPTPTPPTPTADLGGDVTVNEKEGTTTVNFLGDTLFDSGQAILKSTAKSSLDKMVAGLKKQYAGKPVKVQGHSDSDPIRKSKWSSNQELSEARANAVRDYLVQKGVEASRITAQGFGSAKPKSSADKSANRRVEIVVMTR